MMALVDREVQRVKARTAGSLRTAQICRVGVAAPGPNAGSWDYSDVVPAVAGPSVGVEFDASRSTERARPGLQGYL